LGQCSGMTPEPVDVTASHERSRSPSTRCRARVTSSARRFVVELGTVKRCLTLGVVLAMCAASCASGSMHPISGGPHRFATSFTLRQVKAAFATQGILLQRMPSGPSKKSKFVVLTDAQG